MKQCPECKRTYYDETLNFCLEDGGWLIDVPGDEETRLLSEARTAETPPRSTSDSGEISDNGDMPRTSGAGRWILFAVVAAAVMLLGGYFARSYFVRGPQDSIDSIAVMPFTNERNDPDTEYLSQGLAESLIYRLSQVSTLKVSPASTVLRYRNTDFDPVKLGRELDVSAVLVGRITQRGDALTISAELIDVRNNRSLWGEQYDRKLSDLLATQREIAREIASRLEIKVSGERGLTKNYTTSNEAYQLHLKGSFYANKRTKPDIERAISYFRQAIELDPNFALAYVGVADAYNAMAPYGIMAPKEAFPQAKVAAMRALEIDPSLAEAHSAYGVVLAAYDWNWTEAEREHKKAIDLDPNHEGPYYYYATGYLLFVGRTSEAIQMLKRAIEIEPLSLNSNARLGTAYGYDRQYDLSLEQARRTFDLDPNFVGSRGLLIESLARNGLYDEAIKIGEETLALFPGQSQATAGLGYVYALSGRTEKANEILDELEELSKSQHVLSARVARISLALGDRDGAFKWLEKAYRDHDWFLLLIKSDPAYDEIRGDPRFASLLARVGLTP